MAQRLQPEKHSEVGLRAFARSGLADAGWALEIAGVGDERDHLERIARELGVAEDVRFLGFRSDVGDLMRRSGVLLATSPFEHFGLTVLEAMAAGLPVVATAAGGHVEMLGGSTDTGLFPPDDAAAAAALLRGSVWTQRRAPRSAPLSERGRSQTSRCDLRSPQPTRCIGTRSRNG